jgi:hypothetical protein
VSRVACGQVTSKDIDKLIRAEVWPFVREQGFTVRGRTARRHWDDAIDVINFQSFNGHEATVLGVTSFSFQLNLGVWPAFPVAGWEVTRDAQGRPQPAEYECVFRSEVRPTVPAPVRKRSLNPFAFRPLPQPAAIWSVTADGANALDCVRDARQGIEAQALPWFDGLRTAEQLLAAMADWPESPLKSAVAEGAARRAP